MERPVFILGGRSDIGVAIAHCFAAEGWPVVLGGRDVPQLQAIATDIALRHGVSASVVHADVLDFEAMAGLFDGFAVLPAVVVCAAGLLGDQAETEGDAAQIRRIVDTNFTGPMIALESAARKLAELPQETAVIGISSVAGDRGRAVNYWYGAAKAGLTAGLSGLRQKHAASRLLVMTVKPGFVRTAMTEGMKLPAPLTSSPEEVASLVHAAFRRRRPVVYHWKWRLVMTVIRLLPERLFCCLKF